MKIRFTNADRQQMKALGIGVPTVLEQVETFRRSDFSVRLMRPCTLGDGVQRVEEADAAKYLPLHQAAARAGRFTKFVPASGAASRMFQSLLQIFYLPQYLEKDELEKRVSQGVSIACDFKRFVEELPRFAFVHSLREVLAYDGYSLEELIGECRFRTLLEYLLTERGLGCGTLPKAMLQFHSYPDEHRTAFEEQLAESVRYLGAESGKCRLHFTIPEEREEDFQTLSEGVCRCYADRYSTAFEVFFSFQKLSTNTIAVDTEGFPFRDRFGRLHFRPAGHGALIENLNDLNADLIYIKNIDNVVPDRLKDSVCFWKKTLGGYLAFIQERVHSLIRRMKQPEATGAVQEAARLARRELLLHIPQGFDSRPEDQQRALLLNLLDRPIRVCGVVPNAGEPGGAPFWVEDENGEVSPQIIEKAQVNFSKPDQQAIWNSSTHFNPVDIVCSMRNYEGKQFDLRDYIDPKAVIITKKSKDGKDIMALELPGLWNGSMARWITVFVEVPPHTFNPVKSVYDLLRPEHQPEQ
ncbi:MAG: DUF4301 family protein [Syntrophobacteraceae bacterium]